MSRKLVEVIQKSGRTFVYHDENVQVVFIMGEYYLARFRIPEVIESLFECMPQDSVSVGRPIERSRGSYSSVHPVVGVFDGYLFSGMGEASVLDSAAVEIFTFVFLQMHGDFSCIELRRRGPFDYLLAAAQVGHRHYPSVPYPYLHFRCLYQGSSVRHECIYRSRFRSRIFHQNSCRRHCLRIPDDPSCVVLENSEDIFRIKVYGTDVSVVEQHFCGRRVDFAHVLHFVAGLCIAGVCMSRIRD